MALFMDISASYDAANTALRAREAAGLQPDMPFMEPGFLVQANAFYLLMTAVLYQWMKSRSSPIDCFLMKKIMVVYNLSCVCLAGLVVKKFVEAKLQYNYPEQFACNENRVLGEAHALGDQGIKLVSEAVWWFYAQKFFEFADTWFFILRKSFRQVTFLHVFHHCSINIVVGLIGPHVFNGDMYLPIVLNAFVHVLMYGHYLAALLGYRTWWKAWLTKLQLTQFTLIALQSWYGITNQCGSPLFVKAVLLGYMGSMLALFGNFFYQSYVRGKKDAAFGGGVVKRGESGQDTQSFSGRCVVADGEEVEVALPPDFCRQLGRSEEQIYQLTAMGKPMPGLHVVQEAGPDRHSFRLAGGNGVVSFTISAVSTAPPMMPVRQVKPKSCCEWEASGKKID